MMKNYETIFRAAKRNDREAFRTQFFQLHVKDQEELYHALYLKNKAKIEQFLTPAEFADLFEWMDPSDQLAVYEVFSNEYIARVLPHVELDNIVKFLSYLDREQVTDLLASLNVSLREQVEELLEFDPETAGSIMNKSYVTALTDETVQAAAERLRASAQTVEMVYYVYVFDRAGVLCGVVSLRDLLIYPAETPLDTIMITKLATVATHDDQEVAARLLQEYDLIALPVLDEAGRMKGIVTVDDVMDVLSQEVTEDFNEFAAISKGDSKDGSSENVWQLARLRMPWIIILIFMGMLSATLIHSFEETLNQVVLLAAFIPIIMDSAGNVGTQSLAIAVRKLSIGKNPLGQAFWQSMWQEFLIGLILGLAAGAVLGSVVSLFFGNPILGAIIAITLVLTLSFSNMVGVIIPVVIHKLKIDPAVASGPFITTINDAIGLLIYFSIATQLLHLI